MPAFKDKLESYRVKDIAKAEEKKVVKSKGDMKWVSLHHHTTFSYLDGFGLPEEHIERAADIGMPAMALTEHGNVSSHAKLERAAKDTGVKPIYGVELYCGPVDEENRGQRKNHLTVLAENESGYRNMLQLVSRTFAEGFYYEPTASGAMVREHAEGLIFLSGCTGSLLATSIIGGKNIAPEEASLERGMEVARRFKKAFGDNYYIEVQMFPELEHVCRLNEALEQIARKLKIPLVGTGDVHYCTTAESEIQQILHNVRGGGRKTLEEQAREWGYDVPLCPPDRDSHVFERLVASGVSRKGAQEAMANSLEIADRCNVVLPKLERLRYPVPKGYEDAHAVWKEWLNRGWRFRGFHRLPSKQRKAYIERVRYEKNIIEQKDFIDYFLVVSEAVRFAKNNNIAVGPARGSAAGSLICYLLRITEVNPLLFPHLIFERFIDVTREDLPDIDLDFDDERRSEVRDYLVSRYGADKVANVGTFTYYKSKNSMDDVARVHKIPKWEVEKVKDLLIERSSGDLRSSATIEDTVEMFDQAREVFEKYPALYKAMELEGNIKAMGVHAAGLVVSNRPITDICAVHARKVKEKAIEVIGIDKYDAEILGLLKMDFLGLTTMGLIGNALDMLGMKLDELYDLPLDDEETIRGFQENDTIGIFQFDGRAMRDVCGSVKPDNFEEICTVNALARPGPLHNGATITYIDVKRGTSEGRKIHPLYDEITKDTNFEIVYQEQILRIVREIGNFPWTHAAYIRRIISRKIGEQEFARQGEAFIKGAIENGLSLDQAKYIWGNCITAGSYAFNAAHSVSYGMLAYWTMWLKRHHPQEFYTSAFRKYPQKENRLLRDAVKHGIKILPPHPTRSGIDWQPEGKHIRAGLTQIPGIGTKTAEAMIEARNTLADNTPGEWAWSDYTVVKGIGTKTMDKVIEFTEQEDPFKVYFLRNKLEEITEAIKAGELGSLPHPTHTASEVPYTSGPDVEVVWLGVIRNRNLRDLFEINMSRTGVPLDPETVKRPDLREWVIMAGEDEDEILNITVPRFRYPEFKQAVWNIRMEHDFVLVHGVKPGFQTRRDIRVINMWVIDPE